MINIPATNTLTPRDIKLSENRMVHVFSGNTDLVKIDFLFEAGSIYQPQLLCAMAANKQLSVATKRLDASAMSEFMDYRGIILECSNTLTQSSLTVYMLHKYSDQVLPIVSEMFSEPTFAEDDYMLWQANRKQELATQSQRTANIARRLFYCKLFGSKHPLGQYATVEDVDKLQLETVKHYFADRYLPGPCDIVASGKVDDRLLDLVDKCFGKISQPVIKEVTIPTLTNTEYCIQKMKGAVQTSMRIGRVLPLRWDDPDYARLMLLVTALGGYFGSRLMSNVREDKGYTYGIYARTQLFRGVIVFYITADVACDVANAAVQEVRNELKRICNDPMEEEELQLVKTVLVGDFLRSIDGVFELSTRYCDMLGTSITERFTDNIRAAINDATAVQLQELAQRLLRSEDMIVCLAGA